MDIMVVKVNKCHFQGNKPNDRQGRLTTLLMTPEDPFSVLVCDQFDCGFGRFDQ